MLTLLQGFRSQHLQEGALDPEFAAFESNVAGPSFAEPPQLPGPAVAATRQVPIANHLENPSWASDFQRLQISGPPNAIPQHQAPFAAPAPAASQRGWQNEFLGQQQQIPAQNQPSYDHGFRPSFTPMYPSHGPQMNGFQPPQDGLSTNQGPAEAFDESAFEAAFEQARADMETDASGTIEQEGDNVEPAAETITNETPRIGSDNIPHVDEEEPKARLNDADELAKTAGHLLDSVQHDHSQKFKESGFLALMRRIRDREVQVEGDEFREVSSRP